jgi:hypothetical protein
MSISKVAMVFFFFFKTIWEKEKREMLRVLPVCSPGVLLALYGK